MALADTARLISSLELQDKFSATAAKYEKTLGSMERRSSTLDKVGFQIGRGARNAIDNVARIGVVAAGAIASQVALGVRSLAQLEQIQNQTLAVIESTGNAANVTAEGIRAQAEALEDLTTIDDKAIQAGQNMLLTFTNIRNEVGEGNDIFDQATEAVLDLSAAMGTEPKQAALQLGKALNDPVRGLTALRRVGIQFTEQQEKQIAKMVESGRTIDAQRVIIAELNKEFGGSAKAFGEGPGATMRRFGDAVEGAQQALATGFLPVMEKVSTLVQETLKDPKVIANITAFGEGLAGGVEDLIDIGMNLPWDAIGQSAKLMGQGAKALLDAFTGLPPWIQTAVLTGWGLNKLTGGALGNIAGTLLGAGTKSLLGMRGGTPATPVFTKEVGIPGTGGPGAPIAGGGRFGGALAFAGLIGAAVAGGLALADFVRTIEDVDAKIGHNFFDRPAPRLSNNAGTPIGQFNPANQGGVVPVKLVEGGGTLNAIELGVKTLRDQVRTGLEENDIHAARIAQKQMDSLNHLRGVLANRINDIIPHLGQVNRGLSTANRNLQDGNARQRELAQGIREARDRIGTGFTAMGYKQDTANARLSAIASKDFSPNVAVTVNASTSVSVSEVARAASTLNFATSLSSQTRHGFTA